MRLNPGMEAEYAHYVEINADPYGSAVVRYGEAWAERMEPHLDMGLAMGSVAEKTSHEGDTEGITGFQYGCAVQALAQFWVFGEALRIWHNLDTQLGDEGERANEKGGVLNPAVLVIGEPE